MMFFKRFAPRLFLFITAVSFTHANLAPAQPTIIVHQNQSSWGIKRMLVYGIVGYIGYKTWRYYKKQLDDLRNDVQLIKEQNQTMHTNLQSVHIQNANNHRITHQKLGAIPGTFTPLSDLPKTIAATSYSSLTTLHNTLTWLWQIVSS